MLLMKMVLQGMIVKRIICLISLGLLFVGTVGSEMIWHTYYDKSHVNDVVLDDGHLWVATGGGGG